MHRAADRDLQMLRDLKKGSLCINNRVARRTDEATHQANIDQWPNACLEKWNALVQVGFDVVVMLPTSPQISETPWYGWNRREDLCRSCALVLSSPKLFLLKKQQDLVMQKKQYLANHVLHALAVLHTCTPIFCRPGRNTKIIIKRVIYMGTTSLSKRD